MLTDRQIGGLDDESLTKLIKDSITPSIRQEVVGYWARITALEYKLKEREMALYRRELGSNIGNDVY